MDTLQVNYMFILPCERSRKTNMIKFVLRNRSSVIEI